jgi:hypothetical protein
MATIRFFRDRLALDDTVFDRLAKAGLEPQPGRRRAARAGAGRATGAARHAAPARARLTRPPGPASGVRRA